EQSHALIPTGRVLCTENSVGPRPGLPRLETRPPSMGNQIRYGSRLSGSGLQATRKRGAGLTGSRWLARIASGSRRLPVVLADQTAQPHPPSDLTQFWHQPDRLVPPVVASRG